MRIRLAFLLLFSLGCTNQDAPSPTSQSEQQSEQKSSQQQEEDFALHFINAYVKNCNLMANAKDILTWTDSTQATTALFRTELKKIIAEADPEYGLEADPIFNAQDYPDDGFVIEKFDQENNLVTLRGKSMPDLVVTILLKNENNNWKIDGCGSINMPNDDSH